MSLSRRGLLLGSAGAALVLAGCGSGTRDSAVPAEAAGFPVTLPGRLGPTTLKAPPKRVVACGYLRDTDLALALGAGPVLSVRNPVFAKGLASWAKPGAGVEDVFAQTGLPLEKIAAARPDLILAADDYDLTGDYPKLTEIAPTLGYLNGPGKDGWQEMAQRTGDALGRRPRADELVRQVAAKIAAAQAGHPEFAGKTFTFGPASSGGIYTISSEADAGARFFSQLGLELSPKVRNLPASATPGRSQISPERLDLLDADVLILSFSSAKGRADLEANPLFQALPAVKRGSYVGLDQGTAIAMAFPSVLSIPFALDAVVPELAAAVERGA
ncbi:ABC transporter substrate-binding protein [Amycolatopsis sp. PS_44_ISF1]|uniref:ABC transporter substrate-binding protein n=1 Tax=Amycolatopsis sp. PS_44_ISF1 TaxID=2974917 RepID=UPI0028E0203F|nr:ABC transporter substrate-binding protein [Amycolatopsis sp. PS_44_ISF1]MDT8913365.1 ABC transporter substrate-binding protein [Amycolatopsis sp. PS_44_ISF1]